MYVLFFLFVCILTNDYETYMHNPTLIWIMHSYTSTRKILDFFRIFFYADVCFIAY